MKRLTTVLLGHAICPQTLRKILSMRHWLDTFGINRLHFFDQGKYFVQVAEGCFRLGIADFDSCEKSNAPNLFQGSDMAMKSVRV